ncbi:uncharacterized protein LOC134822252 [Bolinopsis microptera]|uniref:uncharacterized protein LOC134822252 n=1 Tax=Bolinopsis microptera TaxID=2820187 RepID=UPI0030791181
MSKRTVKMINSAPLNENGFAECKDVGVKPTGLIRSNVNDKLVFEAVQGHGRQCEFPVTERGEYLVYETEAMNLKNIMEMGICRVGEVVYLSREYRYTRSKNGAYVVIDWKNAITEGMVFKETECGGVITRGFEGVIPPKFVAWTSMDKEHHKTSSINRNWRNLRLLIAGDSNSKHLQLGKLSLDKVFFPTTSWLLLTKDVVLRMRECSDIILMIGLNDIKPSTTTLLDMKKVLRRLLDFLYVVKDTSGNSRLYVVEIPPSLSPAISARSRIFNSMLHDKEGREEFPAVLIRTPELWSSGSLKSEYGCDERIPLHLNAQGIQVLEKSVGYAVKRHSGVSRWRGAAKRTY